MSHFSNDLFILTFRASARIINCKDTGNPEFQKIKSRAFSSGGAENKKRLLRRSGLAGDFGGIDGNKIIKIACKKIWRNLMKITANGCKAATIYVAKANAPAKRTNPYTISYIIQITLDIIIIIINNLSNFVLLL
jgi:hypothetical protein